MTSIWCLRLPLQVCVVHNETTTGVTSDIKGCREAMDRASHPALLLVSRHLLGSHPWR